MEKKMNQDKNFGRCKCHTPGVAIIFEEDNQLYRCSLCGLVVETCREQNERLNNERIKKEREGLERIQTQDKCNHQFVPYITKINSRTEDHGFGEIFNAPFEQITTHVICPKCGLIRELSKLLESK